jgi:hypothetical protein
MFHQATVKLYNNNEVSYPVRSLVGINQDTRQKVWAVNYQGTTLFLACETEGEKVYINLEALRNSELSFYVRDYECLEWLGYEGKIKEMNGELFVIADEVTDWVLEQI